MIMHECEVHLTVVLRYLYLFRNRNLYSPNR